MNQRHHSAPTASLPVRSPRRCAALTALLLASLLVHAVAKPSLLIAEEPPATQPLPQVQMSLPLGVPIEQTLPVKVRGLHLDAVTAVRSNTAGVAVKFLKAGKANVPGGLKAEQTGDTQVEFELTLTDQEIAATGAVADLVFVAPAGETSYRMPIAAAAKSLLEVEPNDGYRGPQPLESAEVVLGQIERPHDVDVYAIELVAQQTLRIRIEAQQHGSALDSLLSFVGHDGTILATNDDHADSRDSQLEVTAPHAGKFFIVLQDANDFGGEAQPYRLVVQEPPPAVSFIRDIAPIVQQQCVACHGPRNSEGGYRMDSFAHMIASGDSGVDGFAAHSLTDSESFRRMTTEDPFERMPFEAEPLNAEQLEMFRLWIEAGRPFDGTDRSASLRSQIAPAEHPPAPAKYVGPWPITALAFSPSGSELFVGGYREVLVLDATSGTLQRRIGNVAERSYRIAMHPNEAQFAVAGGTPGQLGEVRLFDFSGELQRVLALDSDVIHDVAYSPSGDRLAVAGSDATIQIFDAVTGQSQQSIEHHLDWVLAVAWSPDGTKLASGSRDKTAKVFNVADRQMLTSYTRHDAAVRGIAFHPSGTEVFTSGANHRWDRWKVEDGSRVRDMGLGGEGQKLTVAGDFFLVPSTNHRVHLMNMEPSDRLHELRGTGEAAFLSVAGHSAADRVAAGSAEGTVDVWELSSGKHLVQFPAFPVDN